ncbi:MAG: methyltransferase domain-containing protein [Hyphomicrobiales bacterium]|nr:methyltransferase domain-containing protein [Hyphomicrobiales bacterium]
MNNQHHPHRFLDTRDGRMATLWDDLLSLQVDLFLAHEVDLLHGIEGWSRARTVLDVGCGNGYFLSRLHELDREKTYVGIDISGELIAMAIKRHQKPGLQFRRCDFLSDRTMPACDFILLRFVVQHLDDFETVLDRASKVLAPGGGMLIVESDLAGSLVRPSMPLFAGLLQAFEADRARIGMLRNRLGALAAIAASGSGWQLDFDRPVAIPSVGPFRGSKTIAVFKRWIDLCESSGGFDYPFHETREELENWSDLESSTNRIMLRAIYFSFDPEGSRRPIPVKKNSTNIYPATA